MQKIRKATWLFEYKDYDILKSKMNKVGITTFKELAKLMNVSNSYISYVVNGQKAVSIEFFEKLKSIGINIDELTKEKTKSQKLLEKMEEIIKDLYRSFTYGARCIFIDGFEAIKKDLDRLEKLEKAIEIVISYLIMFNDVSFDTFLTSQCVEEEQEICKEVFEEVLENA